jgi:RHS repeat-associated protein
MKTKLTLALVAIITGSAFAAIPAVLPEFKNEKQLAEWRAEMAAKHAATTTASEDHAFYTGKPYIESTGGYAFKYRSYNPELARWTSEDPSGFPDGANQSNYAPTPTSELDWAGLLAINPNIQPVSNQINNGGVIMNTLTYMATTTKGNQISVEKLVSVVNQPPHPPVPGVMNDFTQNCHGYVYLPGYWINNNSVATILADEWKETSQKNAKIVVYEFDQQHSVKVASRFDNGNVKDVIGKNGYAGVVTLPVGGTGYSNPKFYE